MNDLSSVEWAPSKAPSAGRQHPPALGNYYPALRPTPPQSGTSTPSPFPPTRGIGKASNNVPPRSSGSTPANDSFANLVTFSGQQSTKNLSLQDQQKLLQAERTKQEAEKRRQFDARFGSVQAASWDTLGDGRATPNGITSPPIYTATNEYGGPKLPNTVNKPFSGIVAPSSAKLLVEEDNDLFSAFNVSTPVDSSSYMSPPSLSPNLDGASSFSSSGAPNLSSAVKNLNGSGGDHTEENDDDPFGLGMDGFVKKPKQDAIVNGKSEEEEEDVLGLLGRPVSEFNRQTPRREKALEIASEASSHPQDRAVAELVDMGFTPEKSRIALEATDSGTEVQAAVGWLLNQAHEESRKKSQPQPQEADSSVNKKSQQTKRTPGRRKSSGGGSAKPAWMREQERNEVSQRRQGSRSSADGEKDSTQLAAEIGTKMFKTANSLWKTGTKKLNQAVADFNSDSDSSQPKWMKEGQPEASLPKPRPLQRQLDANDHDRMAKRVQQQPIARNTQPDVTDEALMLEADSRPPPRKTRLKADVLQELPGPPLPSRSREPQEQSMPQAKFMQQQVSRDPRAKLSRQAVEEEASQAYISPARRKMTAPKPPPTEQGPDPLFDSSLLSYRSAPTLSPPTPTQAVKRLTTFPPPRPPPPKRNIPAISPFALQASAKARQEGTLAFKRGDYALATTLYSTGISAIPSTHPLIVPILTNRALSHLKTGDPKAAVADAKSALDIIGPSRGASETVDLSGDEGVKPMITYWEKAMTRQAEALEQLERWPEAAAAWKACVEAGLGGATSIAGRNRCEKAAAGPTQPQVSAARKPAAAKPRPKVSAFGDLAPESAQSAEAVSRLRAANAAADRIDDEKFALADIVDLRVKKWRLGKESNLRALLSTLQNVLWEGSGWKEIGMGELLMPGKVKINYMKGIAKVHPDKVSGLLLLLRALG